MSNVEATGIHSSAGRSAPLAGAGHTAGSTAAPSVDDTMCTRTNIPARRMASRQKNGSPANGPREWVGDVARYVCRMWRRVRCCNVGTHFACLQRDLQVCGHSQWDGAQRSFNINAVTLDFPQRRKNARPWVRGHRRDPGTRGLSCVAIKVMRCTTHTIIRTCTASGSAHASLWRVPVRGLALLARA